MSASANGNPPKDPRVLSAVMAAVQAYLDDEARANGHKRTNALSAWKTAAWRNLRGSTHVGVLSWRHGA